MPDKRRFWEKVARDPDTDCWEWTASRSGIGYGRYGYEGRTGYAHRYSYEIHTGPIPPDREIDHLCDNRGCVNPAHLTLATRQENMHRSSRIAAQLDRTHCRHGHEYDEANTYWASGARRCRACNREAQRRWKVRHAA